MKKTKNQKKKQNNRAQYNITNVWAMLPAVENTQEHYTEYHTYTHYHSSIPAEFSPRIISSLGAFASRFSKYNIPNLFEEHMPLIKEYFEYEMKIYETRIIEENVDLSRSVYGEYRCFGYNCSDSCRMNDSISVKTEISLSINTILKYDNFVIIGYYIKLDRDEFKWSWQKFLNNLGYRMCIGCFVDVFYTNGSRKTLYYHTFKELQTEQNEVSDYFRLNGWSIMDVWGEFHYSSSSQSTYFPNVIAYPDRIYVFGICYYLRVFDAKFNWLYDTFYGNFDYDESDDYLILWKLMSSGLYQNNAISKGLPFPRWHVHYRIDNNLYFNYVNAEEHCNGKIKPLIIALDECEQGYQIRKHALRILLVGFYDENSTLSWLPLDLKKYIWSFSSSRWHWCNKMKPHNDVFASPTRILNAIGLDYFQKCITESIIVKETKETK